MARTGKTIWSSLGAALIAAHPGAAQILPPSPPTAPPPVGPPPAAPPPAPQGGAVAFPRTDTPRGGGRLVINGRAQRAAWLRREGGPDGQELWLPLEVLQEQLGFASRSRTDGSLELEWYGVARVVPPAGQRPLGDEVGVEVAGILSAIGVRLREEGGALRLELPPPPLLQVRTAATSGGGRRLVFDLGGPALVRSEGGTLRVGVNSQPAAERRLAELGVTSRADGGELSLTDVGGASPARFLTLGSPPRLVIDLPAGAGGPVPRPTATAAPDPRTPSSGLDPRLQALLGDRLRWDRIVRQVGGRPLRINAVRIDPRTSPLTLRPLSRPEGMEGLSSLPGLARRFDALVAINGGYFNRVRRLPLGALRDQGRWLSGPILNRGVVAWESQGLPRFGRLQLEQWAVDARGTRWPVEFLNSGFVKRGLSRYTAEWGPFYRPLSSSESALLLRDGVVRERFDGARLAGGVPLGPGDQLLVARAGTPLPAAVGERLTLESRPSSALGLAPNILGGGPLLLLDGQLVLNGAAEGFGSAFVRQGAPRTVIGSDGTLLWLVTLEGVEDEGPTLSETAVALQQLGLRDALNLDGGSSTGLVMGGAHTVKGRGVGGSIHNGLGLVPRSNPSPLGGGS